LAGVTDDEVTWSADKLSALRLGRRLAVEVLPSAAQRRAFVSITPSQVAADAQARQEGWTHADTGRSFQLELWEYDADRVDGFDYDIGAVLLRSTRAADESILLTALQEWQLHPRQFLYAWDSGDPR
jgi:hypothetical protein